MVLFRSSLLGLGLALGLVLSLIGCLEGREGLAPVAKNPQNQPQASALLSLPKAALTEFALDADVLLVRVAKAAQPEAEILPAFRFPLSESGSYTLEGLPLGDLIFSVELLRKDLTVAAEGSLRALIGLGAQTLPSLVLKPKAAALVALDLALSFKLTGFPGEATPVDTSEPAAVRALLKSYRCESCHNAGARPSAGLNLKNFPYKNLSNDDLLSITRKIYKSFQGLDGISIMPPAEAPSVAEADQNAVLSYIKVLEEAARPSPGKVGIEQVEISINLGGTGLYQANLVKKDDLYRLGDELILTAGRRYAMDLKVYGTDRVLLLDLKAVALDVPSSGKIALEQEIIYSAPVVSLPIEIAKP